MNKTAHPYQPSRLILERYADVLVNFALGKKEGIKKGDVVQAIIPDVAKPLAVEIQKKILQAGGHALIRLEPTGLDKDFYELASHEQLTFFPAKHLKSRADLIDHTIGIIAEPDPYELTNTDPKKIMAHRNSRKRYMDWTNAKEQHGLYTWTVALWGVQAKADLVGLTLEEYWQQIIKACFLDETDPIAHWREVKRLQEQIRTKLNRLSIEWLHITGADVDLTIKLGANRIWKGGADRNIPSFELFTSPDWRSTAGWIKFNQPLYRYGNVLDGIRLEFADGVVTNAHARTGNKFLQEMLQTENANKVGEFSLTDSRLSHITHAMAETLYDENIGGQFGNTHIAVGMAYRDCYRGKTATIKKAQWLKMGYNDSAEHTDIVSTTDRTVVATLSNGSDKTIYADGRFQV